MRRPDDHVRLAHVEPEVVPLARALSDAAEDRQTAVLESDVVDQLHDEHGLSDARSAEQPGLPPPRVGLEQIDHLDTRLEHLRLGGLLQERGGRAVNGPGFCRRDGSELVHGLAEDIHHPPQRAAAHRNLYRTARVFDRHAADHAVRRFHRDGAHAVLPEMLSHLGGDIDLDPPGLAVCLDPQGIVDRGKLPLPELHIEHRPDHLDDLSFPCHSGLLPRPALSRVRGSRPAPRRR